MTGPTPDPAVAAAPSPRSDGTGLMLIGAIMSAAGAYLFQVIAGQALGEVDFAPIAIIWTLQFLGFTVLYTPIEQFIIRRLTISGGRLETLRSAVPIMVAVIAAGAVGAAVFALATRDRFFQGEAVYGPLLAMLFVALGTYAIARGLLAGQQRFATYGIMVGAEAVTRVGLGVAVIVIGATTLGMAWAMVLAPFVYLAFRPKRPAPRSQQTLGEDEAEAHKFLGGLVVTAATSQTILAAGPLVVGALDAAPGEVSTFFATFTLFRGPLTASYNLLARILPWFTHRAARGDDARLGRWSAVLGVAAIGLAGVAAVVGALIGPAIIALLFPDTFRPSGGLAALATAGVVLAAVALFLGQILVARGTTAVLASVWVVALVVAGVALLGIDASPSVRTGWAFVAGEGAALAGTVLAVIRTHR